MDHLIPEETGTKSTQTKKTKQTKKNILPFILVGILALLALSYSGFCAFTGLTGQIYPNISVVGIPLGGMTQEEALETLSGYGTGVSGQSVTLSYDGQTTVVDGSLVSIDVASAVQTAYDMGREGGFFTYGTQWISYMGSEHEISTSLSWTEGGEAQLKEILEAVQTAMVGDLEESYWEIVGDTVEVSVGQPGIGVDTSALSDQVWEAFTAQTPQTIQVEVSVVDPEPIDLEAIYTEIHSDPVNASLDKSTYAISDSSVGVSFDLASAQSQVDAADQGETVSIPLVYTQPTVTSSSLSELLFRDIIGEATSTVSGTSNRKSNVALAASACDGQILLPGEIFTYNGTTGSRTADKGYLPAPAYVGGKSENEVGGGICQVSSTIYWAALRAGVEIVERYNHSYTVGYVPDGMDATVYYGSLDFRFQNDTDYPIKIDTTSYTSGGVTYLQVQIYGTKVDDISYVMTNSVISTTAYSVEYELTDAVAAGSRVQTQSPYTGKKVEVYRSTYNGSTLISTTLETSNTYKSRNAIYQINPADAALYGLSAEGWDIPETTPEEGTEVTPEEGVETTPEETTPETTVPEDTTAETTTPEASTPVETTPDVAVPAEPTPEVEVPAEPTPVEPTPEVEVPVETVPEASTPVETAPEATTPVETTPEATTPVETTPETEAPVASTPEVTE